MNTAIIVLNYNDCETTKKYIDLIKDYKSITKIVVVDNNSPNGDYSQLISFKNNKIDVIKSDKNGGYSYGNNYAIHYLEKKYGEDFFDTYIISNPDVYVEDDVIDKCNFKLHSSSTIGIVAPRMYFEDKLARRSAWKRRTYLIDIANSTRITEALFFFLRIKGEYPKKFFVSKETMVDNIAGSFFLIKSDVMKNVGYFDENTFLFFEEDILGVKLKERNLKIVSMNDINFIHYESRTIGKLMNAFKKQKILFKSRKYFHKKYNNINMIGILIFDILYLIRCIELVFEIPILKLYTKLKNTKGD